MPVFATTRTEPYEQETLEYRAFVDEWAKEINVGLTAIFKMLNISGKAISWGRERYYGRAKVTPSDITYMEGVRSHGQIFRQNDKRTSGSASVSETEFTKKSLDFYKQVVKAMCKACAPVDENQTPKCWDAICPLRPVSPLQLSPKAKKQPPLSSDEIDRGF